MRNMDRYFILKIITGVAAVLVVIFMINRLFFSSDSGNEEALAEGLSYLNELENRDVATINEEILALNTEETDVSSDDGISDPDTDDTSNADGSSIVIDISETGDDSENSSDASSESSEADTSIAENTSESEATAEATATETTEMDEATAAMLASWQEQINSGNITVLTEEERASYRSRFSSCVVIGDSMAQAVLEYGFLDSSHVFYRRGYAIGQLDGAIDEALAMYPSTVIFFTGLNDTDYYDDPEFYAAIYLEKIQYVQSTLPNANVYVCSMLPPSDALGAVRADLARAPLYDAALESICNANGINYIDTKWMVNQSLYMADGIHFISEFYDIWIQYMAYCTGL